jgi:formylglycine-generating enzyme required for sulfatase activity
LWANHAQRLPNRRNGMRDSHVCRISKYHRFDNLIFQTLGAQTGMDRVGRGVSWFGYAALCRSAIRYDSGPGYRDNNLGFRLSWSIP